MDFGYAVHAPHGVSAMLGDMFHVNRSAWGFRYSDLNVPIQVWYGGVDDTAPHGEWICGQLGIKGRCIAGSGHGLIFSEFGPIICGVLAGANASGVDQDNAT